MAGGCQCGAIGYEVTTMPMTLYACHCTECQRQSSASFGLSMPVEKKGFHLRKGKPQFWQRTSASGRAVKCAYCPHCGTRLYHAPARNPAIVNVKPGTLADTKWISPVGHLWLGSAQAWILVPEDAIRYSEQPDSFERLFQAWSDRYAIAPT